MAKLGLFATIATIIGALTFANMSTPAAGDDPDQPCVTKDFKTEMAKAACAKGGQKEAKAVMKAWNKEKNIKSCNDCHKNLAPKYDLKPDGLEKYKKLGGK